MTISKTKTFRNVVYTGLTKGVALVCVAVTSSVVARNLSPSDYGVVGFAVIIIGFLRTFSDLGLDDAVVRRPTIDQRSLRTAFTLKVILSCAAFVAAYMIAPFAHHFFEHPATGNVVRFLALNFLVSVIGFMPLVMLTRDQNYRALVLPGVIGSIVRCILAVTLIYLGWKYWAVVVADVGATLAIGVAIQLSREIPFGLSFDWPVAEEYLRFGMPLLGSGILVFLLLNLDNFLVGSVMGATKLGYYALAFAWGSFICGLLGSTVNAVLLPALSAIQNNPVAMRRWYLKTIDLVAFVSVAANTALLANASFFLVTFLGKGTDKWLPATLTFKILCVYGILRAINEPLGPCLLARGRTKTLLHSTLLSGTMELLLLLLVIRTGRIELVAGVVVIAYVSQAFVYLPYLRRDFSLGFGEIAGQMWPVVPAIIAGCLITSLLPDSLGRTIPTLAVRGMFTAAVVALVHGICTRFRCFREASGMIAQNFARGDRSL